jgi:Tfp pilus assembly protein PilF
MRCLYLCLNAVLTLKAVAMKTCCEALFLSAVLLSGGHALAADTPANESLNEPTIKVADRLHNARSWIAAKDWSKALAELQAAVREEPRNADVHNLLGYTYRKQTSPNLSKAFQHYDTALQLNPRHLGAHEYIGEAYLMAKKPAQAAKHLAQLQTLCGKQTCEEYVDLARALADYKAANP